MKQISNLIINYEKCTNCGFCESVCPAGVIETDQTQPVENHAILCIECGHCVAICPTSAIEHKKMDMNNFSDINDPQISFQQFHELVKNRRSIRAFKDESLGSEKLEMIFDILKYSPTAENLQELKYVVITNREQLEKIKAKMAKIFNLFGIMMKNPLSLPFFRKELREALKMIKTSWKKYKKEGGKELLLGNTPCLLLVCYKKKNRRGDFNFMMKPAKLWNAGIATDHIMLAAQTIGIGTCCNGFHTVLGNFSRSLKKLSSVPKGYKIGASICLGIPKYNYRKICDRKPLDVQIFS